MEWAQCLSFIAAVYFERGDFGRVEGFNIKTVNDFLLIYHYTALNLNTSKHR
jgi:hypothetical protein